MISVIGAASGIGAATAELFAKYGSRLALMDRNLDQLQEVAQKCRETGRLGQDDVSEFILLFGVQVFYKGI